jgi:endogenous inhibitor of DNA gyrase (YacG/DUF329 family)
MRKMEKMKCPNCGKTFSYEEVNNVVEHSRQEIEIVCPYCKEVASKQISNGYFITQKIEDYLH